MSSVGIGPLTELGSDAGGPQPLRNLRPVAIGEIVRGIVARLENAVDEAPEHLYSSECSAERRPEAWGMSPLVANCMAGAGHAGIMLPPSAVRAAHPQC
jgi:hypothetical protein